MPPSTASTADEFGLSRPSVAPASAVAWGAIVAGAAAAAALSLLLLILGTGLGLSSVSPWAPSGVSATTFGVSTILWVTFTQVVAAAMGGYLAGRLRTKWTAVHRDEVYFRDTAHGFLAWAVASLAMAALLGSAVGAIVGGGVRAGGSVAGTAAAGVAGATSLAAPGAAREPMAYFVDMLFRRDAAVATPPSADTPVAVAAAAEVTRIFVNPMRADSLPAPDLRYVGQLVAQHTGLSQPDAEKRVSDTHARWQAELRDAQTTAKEAADKARKASAYAALWLFVSLLAGAFVASLAATQGGRQRDL